MELRNCPECGGVFAYVRTNLCPACQKIDEEDFRKVRTFIIRNAGASIIKISEQTDVSEKKIMRYIREGRIKIGSDSGSAIIECEVCGKKISSGRLCEACNEKLSSGIRRSIRQENMQQQEVEKITEAKKDETEKKGHRMYTMDHWRKNS